MVSHRCSRLLQALLTLGFLLTSLRVQAEPLHPLLSPAAVDSVRALLQQSKPDTNRVNLLLLLGEDCYNKRKLSAASLDSADQCCAGALSLSNTLRFIKGQIRSGYLLGIILSKKKDRKQVVFLIAKSLSLSRKIGHQPLEAEGWYCLGEAYDRSAEGLPKKIQCYQQSRELYRQVKNREKEAYMLKQISDMHFVQGQYTQAYSELLEVMNLYRSVGYRKLHYTYDLLAVVNQHMGDYQEAIRYRIACIESAQATKDTVEISLFYRRLGAIYQELNQWEEGIRIYHKALANYRQANDSTMILRTARKISAHLLGQGKAKEALTFYQKIVKEYPPRNSRATLEAASALAECFLTLKQYALAETYYRKVISIENTIQENGVDKVYSYQRMGNFYLIRKQYHNARQYLDTALYLNRRAGTLREAVNIHLLLFKLDSAQGNYFKAIGNYQRYKALNDSIFNETKSRQTASLQIRYSMKEKEQNITLLTKQNLVQQAHIQQRELQRNSLIVGVLLLLLSSGVIFNRYRLKQRTNRLLEAKQQEINQKNQRLEQVLGEKEGLLLEKDNLLEEKENLLTHKDYILLEKDGLLKEKEWLLKEVHHRVKNNLQVVVSLLSSQAAYLLDEKALTAIQESQNRIHAISLIHQRLYLSENIALVEMATYIHDVADYLLDSFEMKERIHLRLAVDSIELDGVIAVPLGLIINEAVTNCLKYAFPNGRTGSVSISLQPVDQQSCLLTIADDGIGLSRDVNLAQTRSLGMVLMKGLTKQLEGGLKIRSMDGLTVSVLFNKMSKKISLEKAKVR